MGKMEITLSNKKYPKEKGSDRASLVVEHLVYKCEVPISNPGTTKKKGIENLGMHRF
jgi:hypothetical protein